MSLKTILVVLITSVATAPTPLIVYCPEDNKYAFLFCL
jgi:hypothetical protein